MSKKSKHSAAREELVRGALPIKAILHLYDDPELTHTSPAVQVDTRHHPHIHITDLARLHGTEGESINAFQWAYWRAPEPQDDLVRLTLTYTAPVRLSFSIVFRCQQHWTVLRWVVEHEGVMLLTDQERETLKSSVTDTLAVYSLLSVKTEVDDLETWMRNAGIRRARARLKRPLTAVETMTAILDAKRFMPVSDAAIYAQKLLHIPIFAGQRADESPFQSGEQERYGETSQELKELLLQVTDQPQVDLVDQNGEPFLVRTDWLHAPDSFEAH